jgi:hypothetical protein
MSVPAIKPAPAPSAVLVKPPLPLLPVKKQIIIPSKSLAPVAVTAKLPALPAYPTFSTTSAKTMSKNTDKCNLSNISFLVENGRLSTVKYRVGNICPSADLDVPVTNNPFVLVINLHTCLSLIFPVVLRFNSGRTILDIVKSIVTVIVAVNKDNFCGDKLAQGHASYVMNDVYINPNKNIVTITVKPI